MVAGALAALGWDDRVGALMASVLVAGSEAGRVVRVDRELCTVATASGEHRARARPLPAVGDWVALAAATGPAGAGPAAGAEATGEVVGVAERWSVLSRRGPTGMTQVLAANVDVVFVTAPADRNSPARVEREVAMAWDAGARPVVLVTKCDVAAPDLVARLSERLVGVDVVATSSVDGAGLDEVRGLLAPNRTAVLLGPSGAGKSTLTDALLGGAGLATAPVRDGDRRGRHTTTARELFVVPTGGVLIDTPGLRSLSLGADHGGVAAAFADVEDLAAGCRFRDCAHDDEPGCAVVAAVEAGILDSGRVTNYRRLRRELDYEARRDDPLAGREAQRVWKARAKAVRQLMKERNRPR